MYMQIRMPLACFLILTYSFWHFMRKERLKTEASRIFQMAAVSGIIHTIAAVVTEYTANNREKVPEALNYIFHVIFLLSLSISCMMIYIYLVCFIERGLGKRKKFQRRVMNILFAVCCIAEIFMPIKYVDTPHGSYSLGFKAYFLYLIVICIIIMMIYDLIKYRRVLESRLCKAIVSSVFIFVSTSLIQIIFPYILLTGLATTMMVIGIMMNTEDSHLYISFDTGFYNESGCKEILRELILRHNEFKIQICVFFGEADEIANAKNLLKRRLAHKYADHIFGSPQYDMLIIMPTARSRVRPAKSEKILEDFKDVKCVSEILAFNSSQSVEEIVAKILEYKDYCCNEQNTDELTGLMRRTGYSQRVNQLIEDNSSFAFVMIDIDNFKGVNDKYGHTIGDEVLKFTAKIFRESIRSTDIACRMGGDEFSIVLCNIADAAIAEKIISKLMEKMKHTVVSDTLELSVCLSAGVKIYTPTDRCFSFEELYLESDKALYEAKNAGKNRVHFADS